MKAHGAIRLTCVVFQLLCVVSSVSAGQGEDVQPVADAGPDQHMPFTGELVILDASGSHLQDPQTATYVWSQVSGPAVALVNPATASPMFVPSEEGWYCFELVVGEGPDSSEPDEVVVWIGFVPTQPVLSEWSIEEGGNGHMYQPVSHKGADPNLGISWERARQWAELGGGYLATITCETENKFVFDLVRPNGNGSDDYWFKIYDIPYVYWFGPWLGACQVPGSWEPDGGWKWVTDEPFDYTAWHSGEPSGRWGEKNEDIIQYFTKTYAGQSPRPLWNDAYDGSGARHPNGFIAEYDPVLREAEYAFVLHQAQVDASNPGFTGMGYLKFADLEGSAAEWDIFVGPAGWRRLTLRFANGADQGSLIRVDVNDMTVCHEVELPPTGAWDAWEDVVFCAPFTPWVNRLRVTLLGGPGPAIDSIGLVGENTNLVLGKAINFSSEDPIHSAAAAIDADLTTSWEIRESPQWVEVDLGRVYPIDRSHIVAADTSAYQFKMQVRSAPDKSYSDPNTTGEAILFEHPNDDRDHCDFEVREFRLAPVEARYVRLEVEVGSDNASDTIAIREFRVFSAIGCEQDDASTP